MNSENEQELQGNAIVSTLSFKLAIHLRIKHERSKANYKIERNPKIIGLWTHELLIQWATWISHRFPRKRQQRYSPLRVDYFLKNIPNQFHLCLNIWRLLIVYASLNDENYGRPLVHSPRKCPFTISLISVICSFRFTFSLLMSQ